MAEDVRRTDSGIEIKPSTPRTTSRVGTRTRSSAAPGARRTPAASTRAMYRGRLWTMRQYAGFGDAESTNQRFKFLLGAGQTGLSCAFDLPTQMGYDSDHPRAEGEVGKVGVAIDSLDDMRLLLDGIPLDKVTTSMTINSTAAILLLLYELVAEEQGVPSDGHQRHDPERPAEGVHRPRHLHLPAPPVDADHHRHLRLLPRARSRSGTRSRSPATTSARPARRRCRRSRSRSPTASPTSRRRSTPASTSTSSRRGCRSSGTPTTTSSKRSPSSAPRGACGTGS